MTKFCSALSLENLLTNIFAKLNLCGGVSCMPAALLFLFYFIARFGQYCKKILCNLMPKASTYDYLLNVSAF